MTGQISVRKFDVARDVNELVSFWSDRNIRVWDEFMSTSLARAHMLEMSYGIDDIGGLDLVAEIDGKTIAIGWVGTFGLHTLLGKVVMYVLGVDPAYMDNVRFFNAAVEELLKFARKKISGDERIGRLRGTHDPDIRM